MALKLTRTETVSDNHTYEYFVSEEWIKDLNGRMAALYVGDKVPMTVTEKDIKAIWCGEPFNLEGGTEWFYEDYRSHGPIKRVSGYYFVMEQLMQAVKEGYSIGDDETFVQDYEHTAEEI